MIICCTEVTPLDAGISNNQLSIVRTLQDDITESTMLKVELLVLWIRVVICNLTHYRNILVTRNFEGDLYLKARRNALVIYV